jgi:hypothetical protein
MLLTQRLERLEETAKKKAYKPKNFNEFYNNDSETIASFNRFYATAEKQGKINTGL